MALTTLPNARDCMTSPVCVLTPNTYLLEAIEQLVRHRLAAAPVTERGGRLLGMLTEKDCLRILSSLTYEHGQDGQVGDYLSPVGRACEPTMDLFRVAELFLQNNFPVLPVQDDGRLVGVISRWGMLRVIQDLRSNIERAHTSFESVAGRQADRPRDIESRQRAAAATSTDQLVTLFRRFGADV